MDHLTVSQCLIHIGHCKSDQILFLICIILIKILIQEGTFDLIAEDYFFRDSVNVENSLGSFPVDC